MAESFPRQYARTVRFTLGRPRSITVAGDGRVVFLRSAGGADRANALHVLDGDSERLVADPAALLGAGDEDLPPEEKARRERARESGGGIVAYSLDVTARTAAFALSGRLFVTELDGGDPRELAVPGPVVDPRISPDGLRVAYVARGRLRVAAVDGSDDREVVGEDGVTWGLPDFVAMEEMARLRGHWWSPDSQRLLAARVDESPVQRWHIADPANPANEPTVLAYPAAGTANALVTLAIVDLEGARTAVPWDAEALPYLARVAWGEGHPPLLQVQSRDQRRVAYLSVDESSGATTVVAEDTDEAWVELVDGVPAWAPDGRLLTCGDREGTRRLLVDGTPLTPATLHVRSVVAVTDGGVVVTASADEPTEVHVYRVGYDGDVTAISTEPGVHSAVAGGEIVVLSSARWDRTGTVTSVLRPDGPPTTLRSLAETPRLQARPELLTVGEHDLRAVLLLPASHDGGPLPVLMDPYGGPHAQRAVAAQDAHLSAQWLADQGFAVIVADGRGSPGRGSTWERAVHGDLAGPPLEDQLAALEGVDAARPGLLDRSKVAIRGWSFGGFLAALAVLRRPDVFAAAIAGAPVTDQRLYDTHYTERYLGIDPYGADAAAYEQSSVLGEAAKLERPLLLIHGLADDNVVAAHTLRLSSALLVAGRPHEVLPLSGVTHMASQEEVAENLLLLQVDFLRRALSLPTG